MVKVEDKYIVGKGREWLKSSRPDLLRIPQGNIFSIYVHDAKRFDTRRDARRAARKVGGKVWTFNPITGSKAEVMVVLPKKAKCDNCRGYTPYDGMCKNPESEFYREGVSYKDVCDEWEDRKDGREGQTDSAVDPGRGTAQKQDPGSGGESVL